MSIVICNYDPRWAEQFARLKLELLAALSHLVVTIEHVGSTSVPGLAAKPILDVDIVIDPPHKLPAVINCLTSIGYTHQGDLGIAGREAFRAPPGDPLRHVYVCVAGARPLKEHLAFRDYLRQNPEAIEAYGLLKRKIAEMVNDDRVAYTEHKTRFIRELLPQCLKDSLQEK
jgi:GrpB-like predicted nucleotidyltransferase (UPF0157 family)